MRCQSLFTDWYTQSTPEVLPVFSPIYKPDSLDKTRSSFHRKYKPTFLFSGKLSRSVPANVNDVCLVLCLNQHSADVLKAARVGRDSTFGAVCCSAWTVFIFKCHCKPKQNRFEFVWEQFSCVWFFFFFSYFRQCRVQVLVISPSLALF